MVKKKQQKRQRKPVSPKKIHLSKFHPQNVPAFLDLFFGLWRGSEVFNCRLRKQKKQRAGKWPRRKTREVLRKVSDSWLFVCVSFFLCFLFSNPMVFGTTIWHKKFIVFLKHDFNSIFSTKIKVETMEKTSINGDSGRWLHSWPACHELL